MKLQVVIGGYMGQPVTIGCVIDDDTGVLSVAKVFDHSEKRMEGFAVVSNMDLPDCDFLFTDKHLRDAIRSYFARVGQDMVGIAQQLARFDPTNRIEKDAVDETGPRYRISPDIDNGQVAVLAAVAFAESQRPVNAALSAMQDLNDFYSVTTI